MTIMQEITSKLVSNMMKELMPYIEYYKELQAIREDLKNALDANDKILIGFGINRLDTLLYDITKIGKDNTTHPNAFANVIGVFESSKDDVEEACKTYADEKWKVYAQVNKDYYADLYYDIFSGVLAKLNKNKEAQK